LAHHNTVFAQLLKFVPRHEFEALANQHHEGQKLRKMSRWSQFVPLSLAQLSGRSSLRDTGLGLTICKKLTELMGGDIWIESEEQSGSSFHFTVPLLIPTSDEQRVRPPQAKVDLGSLRVLVVDDNATSREILSTMLQGFGLRADSVSSGAEALELLEEAVLGKSFEAVT